MHGAKPDLITIRLTFISARSAAIGPATGEQIWLTSRLDTIAAAAPAVSVMRGTIDDWFFRDLSGHRHAGIGALGSGLRDPQ